MGCPSCGARYRPVKRPVVKQPRSPVMEEKSNPPSQSVSKVQPPPITGYNITVPRK